MPDQAEPIDEALLQDHQLLDRATYLEVLAGTAGEPWVEAHTGPAPARSAIRTRPAALAKEAVGVSE